MTSIQIANECINSVNAYNKEALKVALALNIDEYLYKQTKELKNEIEALKEQIQFLEGRLESRRAING